MRIIDILHSPWAIMPDRLIEIAEIYARHLRGEKISKETISLIEAQIGRPLDNKQQAYEVRNGIAVLPVTGIIAKRMNLLTKISGGTSTYLLARDFRAALDDSGITGIVLLIDSPGGTVDGTQELAQLIYSARGHKPVIALSDGIMASAAYWIASAADRVYITGDTVEVGSIGVVSTHTDYSKANESAGVKITEITAGRYKRIVSENAPLTDEGKAYIQQQLDHLYNIFLRDVGKYRGGMPPDRVHAQMGDGRIFLGHNAISVGLVDGVATLDKIITYMAAGELPDTTTRMISMSTTSADSASATMEVNMALTHNSTLADDEPEWGDWIGNNESKLPDNAFASEEDRSYPHHWVKNGETGEDGRYSSGDMYLHRGGLNAAWAAANGARSGQKASSDIIAHLEEHRRAIGMEEEKKEETSMTISDLMKNHPDMYQAVYDAGYKDGIEKGKSLELERIKAIKALSMPGMDDLIESLMFDSTTTAQDAAVKIIAAEKAKRQHMMDVIKKEGAALSIPHSDGTVSAQTMSRAEFEKLTPAQRVAFLKSGGKLQN